MYTILLDSSNTKLAVGLEKEGILLTDTTYEAWQEQSEHMIPELDKILTKFHVERKDIDDIIVAIGPGSYTGVRIAITIAKTMALALNIPIYPVSSLHVLKKDNVPSICLINARSKRSYIGVYEGEKVLLKDQIMTNDEVLEYIKAHQDYAVCGDLKYLNIDGYQSKTVKEMVSLHRFLNKCPDNFALKPVYMKD